MKHKHAELIKAWADGAVIEWKYSNGGTWHQVESIRNLIEYDYVEYRIKPEPKPDEITFWFLDEWNNIFPRSISNPNANLKIIRDGETGELKSAEVLK